MRGLSKSALRAVAGVSLIAILVAPVASAESERLPGGAGISHQLQRAKRFVISVLHRIGWPPGDAEPTSGGES